MAVRDWLRRGGQQVFRLFGYAGTGKTTLARHIAEGVDGEVTFGAFTGKAALVLRAKIRGKPRLLDATLTELAKDRAHLAQRVKAVR